MNRLKKRSIFILVLGVATLPLSCVSTGYEKKTEDTALSTYQDDMDVFQPEEPAIEKDRQASIPLAGHFGFL